MNRVVSPTPMLNWFQWMTAPLLVVTLSVAPLRCSVALPWTTCAPVGLAQAGAPIAAIAPARSPIRQGRDGGRAAAGC